MCCHCLHFCLTCKHQLAYSLHTCRQLCACRLAPMLQCSTRSPAAVIEVCALQKDCHSHGHRHRSGCKSLDVHELSVTANFTVVEDCLTAMTFATCRCCRGSRGACQSQDRDIRDHLWPERLGFGPRCWGSRHQCRAGPDPDCFLPAALQWGETAHYRRFCGPLSS